MTKARRARPFTAATHLSSLALLGLAAASGCAFGARHVDLTYPASLAGPGGVAASGARVAVAKLGDARETRQGTGRLLGKVRNGYGIPTASVLASQDPVLWVSDGLVRGLKLSGFEVERVESPVDAGDLPTVTGTVLRASGGMYMSMDANVAADLVVERRGERLLSAQCDGRASKVAWTASASEYRQVFQDAMGNFILDCVRKLSPALSTEALR
jgi:hypothetical protein